MKGNKETRKRLYKRLLELCKNHPQGFTTDKNGSLLNLKKGYAVSLTNNKQKNISRLISQVLSFNKPLNAGFGGWLDNATNEFYLDVTQVKHTLNTALSVAKRYNQKAIFNFANLKTINVK